MARQSECEHDIGFYRVVGGDGLDVVEACGECGAQIVSESPKTRFEREAKEEESEARKKRRAVNKRKRTIAAKKEVEEDEDQDDEYEEEDESIIDKAKDSFRESIRDW